MKTLEKIASKNAKNKIIDNAGRIKPIKNGEEMGRKDYLTGKKNSIVNGREASRLKAMGRDKEALNSIVEGAKGAGTASTVMKNRAVFNRPKSGIHTQIGINDQNAYFKSIGLGEGKKSDSLSLRVARREAEKLPSTTVRPVKALEKFKSVKQAVKAGKLFGKLR